MARYGVNIYAAARKTAGLTQTAAALRLAVSVETLSAYETGQRIPAAEVVDSMVTIYGTDYLALQYVREISCTARKLVPAVQPTDLLPAAVRLYNALRQLEARHTLDQLMQVVADGKITPEEEPIMDQIMGTLREIQTSALEWAVLYPGGGDTHDA